MKTATSGFISAISDGCPYHMVKFYYNGTELDINTKSFNATSGLSKSAIIASTDT